MGSPPCAPSPPPTSSRSIGTVAAPRAAERGHLRATGKGWPTTEMSGDEDLAQATPNTLFWTFSSLPTSWMSGDEDLAQVARPQEADPVSPTPEMIGDEDLAQVARLQV